MNRQTIFSSREDDKCQPAGSSVRGRKILAGGICWRNRLPIPSMYAAACDSRMVSASDTVEEEISNWRQLPLAKIQAMLYSFHWWL